jgi:curli biogenesis system outer membrane secretion channel CsgG
MMKLSNVFVIPTIAAAIFAVGCTPKTTSVHEDKNVQVALVESGKEAHKGPKLRVGVVNFKNDTPRKVRDIEKAATNILTTMLGEAGSFIVVPQQDMKSILDQQKLGASGAINASTAAKMGQILGLNAILTGSITSYAELVEGSNTLLTQSKTQVAKVGVDYRIVDTTTGQQLFAAHGKGEFRKESGGFLGFGSKSSRDTSLKDGALRDALGKAMNKITQQLTSDRWSGRIASIKGSNVYINAGKQQV